MQALQGVMLDKSCNAAASFRTPIRIVDAEYLLVRSTSDPVYYLVSSAGNLLQELPLCRSVAIVHLPPDDARVGLGADHVRIDVTPVRGIIGGSDSMEIAAAYSEQRVFGYHPR